MPSMGIIGWIVVGLIAGALSGYVIKDGTPSGCIANLTASRISRDRTRKIRFFQRDAYISIDTGAKEAEVYRLVRSAGCRPAIEGGKIPVPDGEPLRNELQDFVDAVRFGRAPLVGGHDGRRAVALAAEITQRMAACTRI